MIDLKKQIYVFIHFFIIISLLLKSKADNSNTYIVSNEDELRLALTTLNDTRRIIIDGVITDIQKEMKLKPPLNSGSITITGKDGRNSTVGFISGTIGFTFENLTYVEIENMSFIGRLNFKHIKEVYVHDINHNGLFDTANPEGLVRVDNIDFISNDKKSRENSVKINNGGRTIIENSRFTASIGCTDSLLKYNGRNIKIKDFTLRNCIFDSKHYANGVIIQESNITIENTQFFNGFSKMHSAFVTIRDSHAIVRNCTFKDGYTISTGGAFNTLKNSYFEATDIKVYNTTTYNGGCLFYEDTDLVDSISILKNIEIRNLWKDHPNNGLGSIINIKQYSHLQIYNLYGEGFYCTVLTCNLFMVFHYSLAELWNIYIKDIRGTYNGIIFYSKSDKEFNELATIKATDCVFANIIQETSNNSSMIWSDGSIIELSNVRFENIISERSGLINSFNNGTVRVDNISFENIYNKQHSNGIYVNKEGNIELSNISIKNILYRGVLISTDVEKVSYKNINVENYNICINEYDTTCLNEQKSLFNDPLTVFLETSKYVSVQLENINLKNLDLYTLFIYDASSNINAKEINVENGRFKYGAINYDDTYPYRIGNITIKDSKFNNIYSDNGPIVYVNSLFKQYYNLILFDNNIIQNTEAKYHGGVIYSKSKYIHDTIIFNSCQFSNNKAKYGSICNAYDIDSEPIISNKDEILKIEGDKAFATNPTNLVIDENTSDNYTILSGNIITDNIRFVLRDDYNKLIETDSNISSIEINDLFFFRIGIDDERNAVLFGQTNGYCWENSCLVPNIRIVGNPGKYNLYLELFTFGKYVQFSKSKASVEINILECDENSYIYQDRDGVSIKSCYKPSCEPQCVNGKCASDNYCECAGIKRRGKLCEEYYPLERNEVIDFVIFVISVLLIILTIIIIIYIIKYRNNEIIKAGSVEFLIIILIGTLLYSLYSICLTFERSKLSCILIHFFNNIGFSLVYGSILIKTYRIYKIFKMKGKYRITKKELMYLFIICITIIHILILLSWVVRDKIFPNVQYDNNEKEYKNCKLPKTRIFCNIINLMVIIVSAILSYSIRDVKKEFNEPLAVPVYIYLLVEVFILIINAQDEMSLIFKDFVQAAGSIISTFIVLYYLYATKFILLFFRKKVKNVNIRI